MKILFAGDSPTIHTGFGIVTKNILNRLHKMGHQITVLGVNHYGNPYDPKEYPYPIFPCDRGGAEQVFGFHKFWEIYKTVQPDVVFFLNDPWLIHNYMQAKPEHILPHTKIIAYYPTDGGPLKPEWVETLNSLDAQICYSHYAEGVVTKSNGNVIPENLHQIYHGVDRSTFFPIDQRLARINLGLPEDVFIVGMVARNQYRKRFDIMMAGFKEFSKNKKDVKLYLHTVLNDIGFDIVDLARQFDISDKLILTEDITPERGVPDAQLNMIYNSFDLHALISMGDGFGLPVAESMATACPQLVSDHSCLKELVDGHGGLTVKTDSWILNISQINTWGAISSYKDVATKLELLYKDKELRLKLAEQAYNYIIQPQYTWNFAADKFNDIIKSLFHII